MGRYFLDVAVREFYVLNRLKMKLNGAGTPSFLRLTRDLDDYYSKLTNELFHALFDSLFAVCMVEAGIVAQNPLVPLEVEGLFEIPSEAPRIGSAVEEVRRYSPARCLPVLEEFFSLCGKTNSGGPPWRRAASILKRSLDCSSESKEIWVDVLVGLQHNRGGVYYRLPHIVEFRDGIRPFIRFLDFRRKADVLEYCDSFRGTLTVSERAYALLARAARLGAVDEGIPEKFRFSPNLALDYTPAVYGEKTISLKFRYL